MVEPGEVYEVQSTFCPNGDHHVLDPTREHYAPPHWRTRPDDLIDYFIYCLTCRNFFRVHAQKRWRIADDRKRLFKSEAEARAVAPRHQAAGGEDGA